MFEIHHKIDLLKVYMQMRDVSDLKCGAGMERQAKSIIKHTYLETPPGLTNPWGTGSRQRMHSRLLEARFRPIGRDGFQNLW